MGGESEHTGSVCLLCWIHQLRAPEVSCRDGIPCTRFGIAVVGRLWRFLGNAASLRSCALPRLMPGAGARSHHSALLLSFPMLPAPHILKGSCRGIRCHQPISHPLVDQGGVRSHSTQQHGEASVQHLADAATQTKPTTSADMNARVFSPGGCLFLCVVPTPLWGCCTFCGSTIDEKAVGKLFGWATLPSPSLPAKQPAALDVSHRTRLSTDALKETQKASLC